MKKIISVIFILFIFSLSFTYGQKTIIKLKTENKKFNINTKSKTNFNVELSISQLELTAKKVKEGNFIDFFTENLTRIYKTGYPNIPVYSKLIEIPFGAELEYKISSYTEENIKLSDYGITQKIIPAQRSISKSEDPKYVPFIINEEVYKKNAFLNKITVEYEYVGTFRDKRIGRLIVRPVQYNPSKNIIKVLNNIVVEVGFKNSDFNKTNEISKKYSSPYFNKQFDNKFVNPDKSSEKAFINSSPVTYVIVSDRMFEGQLEEFINWKKLKGFNVIVGYTDVIGNTNIEIKNYLQNLYENPTTDVNPPSFVLFVGDVQQIPAWDAAGHVTDLRYCEYTGDNLPEVYYGRFSAQNTTQLQAQIDKTLLYEKYLMADPTYLEDQVLVAGVDSDYAPTHGNGAINYAVDYYSNDSHSINPLTYLYNDAANSTVMTSNNNSASSSIISNINQGVGFGNYTAHCSSDGWADPGFSVSNVPGLTNYGKYGLLIGNCCQSVTFNINECFGEAILRAENKGAIGYIGGSNNTHWDEDYWWGVGLTSAVTTNPTYENSGLGAYDGVFHDKENELANQNNWFVTQAQIMVCGNLAVEASSSSRKQYYWEIYHLMGDPSLVPYMGVPTDMTVSFNPSVLSEGMNTLEVTTVPNAYVALSQNGQLVATAYSNSTIGVATLSFTAGSVNIGEADIVITAQNKKPYIGKIQVNSVDEPYIALSEYTTDIDPDYNETLKLNVTLTNIAEVSSGYDASNVSVTLLTEDVYVAIIDGTHDYESIIAGSIKTLSEVFEVKLSDNIPDQHVLKFNLEITGSDAKADYTWNSSLYLTANAPKFEIESMKLSNDSDGNGRLDPGESAELTFTAKNIGHADAEGVNSLLSINSQYINIDEELKATSINVNDSETFLFNISANNSVEDGTKIYINNFVSKGDYNTKYHDSLIVGQPNNIVVGTGTSLPNEYYAFDNYWKANKTQILYKGSELGIGKLDIQKIAFDFSTVGSIQSFNNLKILLKQTNISELSSSYDNMSDATIVFNETEFTMPYNTGWYEFDIEDYSFNTDNNLLIEISWGLNDAYSDTRYRMNSTECDKNYVTYGYSDNESSPGVDGSSNIRPNTKFVFKYKFTCNFGIKNMDLVPISNATITIGNEKKDVDDDGTASFILSKGNHTYNVIAEGYYDINDNFTFGNYNDVLLKMSKIPEYNAGFLVKNSELMPIPNSTITIGTSSIETDYFGRADIILYEGEYTYKVSAVGYHEENKDLTCNIDEDIIVIMNKIPKQIKILSNPVKDKILKVEMIAFFDSYRVEVYNMFGQIIYAEIKSENVLNVNLSDQSGGVYLFKIITDDKIFKEKIILR